MGWQEAQAVALVGNPEVMWFGTLPPIVAVLLHEPGHAIAPMSAEWLANEASGPQTSDAARVTRVRE